eukprot:3653835-Pyramimonas_sp.AAC.1
MCACAAGVGALHGRHSVARFFRQPPGLGGGRRRWAPGGASRADGDGAVGGGPRERHLLRGTGAGGAGEVGLQRRHQRRHHRGVPARRRLRAPAGAPLTLTNPP